MRKFVLFGAAIALAGAVSCGRKFSTGIVIDPAFGPLIASDTKALAGADIEKLKNTPFYKKHQDSLAFPPLDLWSERIGLDPRRDLTDVCITWNGKQPLVLTRGHFKATAVQQKLLTLGAQRDNYKRYVLLSMGQSSVVFLKNSVALGGPTSVLRTALDTEAQGEGAVPEELEARLHVLPKGDQIWEASRGGLPFTELSMRSDYASALSNIAGYVDGTSIGIGIDTGAHVLAELTCTSEQGAQRVHDGLRAALAIGRLTTKNDQQDLLRIYDAIQVDRNRQVVRVKADFPADLADRLAGYLTSLQGGVDKRGGSVK